MILNLLLYSYLTFLTIIIFLYILVKSFFSFYSFILHVYILSRIPEIYYLN